MAGKVWIVLLLAMSCILDGVIAAVAAPATQLFNSIGMEFVLVPAGSFFLEHDEYSDQNQPRRRVIISKAFYLGKYEVTQEQWVAVMGSNPSKVAGRANPVEMVSWDDTQEFIKRLNAREEHMRYRLPTEMEWEYAARGGTDTSYFFMPNPQKWEDAEDLLDAYAWFYKNSAGHTHPVGQKKPNPYGLYDIYGNVWEWTQDWYAELPQSLELTDYRGPATGTYRVDRGGSRSNNAELCRSGRRDIYTPDYRYGNIGFRLALSTE